MLKNRKISVKIKIKISSFDLNKKKFTSKSLCCFNDEIFVPLQNGKVIKVPWNDKRTDHFFLSLQRTYFQYEPDTDCKFIFKLFTSCSYESI